MTARDTFVRMLLDAGPLDTPRSSCQIPFHFGPDGPNKSVHLETGLFLKNLADYVQAKTIVEVGTFTGYSTAWLMLSCWMRGEGTVTTFDIVRPNRSYHFSRYGIPMNFVSLQIGTVWDAELEGVTSIDMVFYDGSHLMGDAARECDRLLPMVRPGGVVVFDDVLLPLYAPMSQYLQSLFYKERGRWSYTVVAVGRGLGVAWRLPK